MHGKFDEYLDKDSSLSADEPSHGDPRTAPPTEGAGKVGFLDLLVSTKPYEYKLKKYKCRKIPNDSMSYEIDDQTKFKNSTAYAKSDSATIQSLSGSAKSSGLRQYLKRKQMEKDLTKHHAQRDSACDVEEIRNPFDLVEWEKDIVYDTAEVREDASEKSTVMTEFVNSILDTEWERYIAMDNKDIKRHKAYVTLYLEDPNLIFERFDEKKQGKIKRRQKEVFSAEKPLRSKYNISCDKYYSQDSKTKNSLGTFGVQHAPPALRLDPAFYKTNHTKEELRNFHRPSLDILGLDIRFEPVQESKAKGQNIIKRANELTLKDAGSFALFEYSEEDPFFIVNCGMVSLLNAYYRKSSMRDDYAPDQSQFTVLDPEDPSPFSLFGDVKPGTSLQALTNNLFTAPVFKHLSSDFICVYERLPTGEATLFYKSIESLYCVGQELPLEEVYAPHSRKLNIFCKNRLKVAAYRLFNARDGKNRGIKISSLDEMFPYFSEGSKRKWLKEYADCIKKGRDNVWVLKPTSALLGEEDLRKLITPENICQYESMLAGERKLQDSGFKTLVESDDEENEEEDSTPPWCLSRNFVNACNGRGLLELNGPGDPTGIGEGFSFRKIRLKKGNEVENRKIISEHQSRYKEEIEKIWSRQLASLSSADEVPFDESYLQHKYEEDRKNVDLHSETTALSENTGLTIRRTYGEGEDLRTEIERIYDPRIIKAYLKARKKAKPEEKKGVLTCGNCGQAGHMKTNKACPNFTAAKKVTKKRLEAERRRAKILLQDFMLKLVNKFFLVPYSSAFHRPVSLKKFPDYAMLVAKPIDLTTIKTKVRHNKYRRVADFVADLRLMRTNCSTYNGEDHSLTKIADSIYEMGSEAYMQNTSELAEAEKALESPTVE
jgi:transcription initiation factor TFIID subunit 1, fungi type